MAPFSFSSYYIDELPLTLPYNTVLYGKAGLAGSYFSNNGSNVSPGDLVLSLKHAGIIIISTPVKYTVMRHTCKEHTIHVAY